jgi:putative ABC transport system permease protein
VLRRRHRSAWTSLTGGFVAVAVGVAIVVLSCLSFASSTAEVPERLSSATVLVTSPAVDTPADPFPPSRPWSSAQADALAGRLAVVPGVLSTVVDRSFYLQPLRDGRPVDGEVEGHGWSSVGLGPRRLVRGRPPERMGEVVLGAGAEVAPGTAVSLLTAAGPRPYTVTGVLNGPGAYLSDVEAAGWAPGVRVIGLLGDPEPSAVRAIVGDAGRVLIGVDRGATEPRDDATTRWIGTQVLTGMAALAGFVTVFVVASTFGFSVTQRRREIALLRAIGAVPGQLRRLLVLEALAVGLLGALVGGAVGAALAVPFGDGLVAAGFQPPTFRVHWTVWPFGAGLLAGPVVAVAGVWLASRRAARIRPVEAIREAAVDLRPMSRVRWWSGVGLAGLGGAAVFATVGRGDLAELASLALLGAMLLVVAAALLAPAIVPTAVRVLTWPWHRSPGATAMLVRCSVLAGRRRTASTAAPILLSVAFAVLIAGSVATTTHAYAAARGARVDAAAVVVPDRAPGLSDAVVRAVGGTAMVPTPIYVGGTVLAGLGVDPASFATANRRLTVVAGDLAGLDETDTVAVTERTSADFGWPVGDTPRLILADGAETPLRVVAVIADASAPAAALVGRTTLRSHDPSALASAVFVQNTPDGMVGARVVDVATYAAEADAADDRLVWLFTLLLVGVSAGYGIIAVANTLLMAAAGRRRDLRVLRLSGATRRQVWFAVAAESAVVVAVGSVLGGAVAFIGLWGSTAGLSAQAGTPVGLVVPWSTIGVVVGTCLVVAVVASLVPTRQSIRPR